MHCTAQQLQCTALPLHCTACTLPCRQPALPCIALHCTALPLTAMHCTAMQTACTAMHCTAQQLQCTALPLHCPALTASALQNAENLRARAAAAACVRAGVCVLSACLSVSQCGYEARTDTVIWKLSNYYKGPRGRSTQRFYLPKRRTRQCTVSSGPGGAIAHICNTQSYAVLGQLWETIAYFTAAMPMHFATCLRQGCTRGRTCTANYQQSAQPVLCFAGSSVPVIIDKCSLFIIIMRATVGI
jgi:hypothetical protein